ncbi:MAG: hypothetical protein KF805_03040 [Phycisphaeraceae bacterium]|nr:hypothetical protein [Phycisphaeraceae bacterium]
MAHHHPHHKSHGTSPIATSAAKSKDSLILPADDGLRLRAFEIFQARLGGPGDALTDWIKAEREFGSGRFAKS